MNPIPTEKPASPSKVKAAVEIAMAVAEAIRELGEIPSGHLYAKLMLYGVTLTQHQSILGTLTMAGLIEVTPAHLVRWIGPAIGKEEGNCSDQNTPISTSHAAIQSASSVDGSAAI